MIFADKLINLRKQNGWSQEELAERLGVSRQAVSKWEGAQSTPDLERILAMSELFGVSTDYLLKASSEEPEYTDANDVKGSARWVSMEEANEFLALREAAAGKIALGVLLCILSPVPLLLLSGFADIGRFPEEMLGVGVVALLALVAAAVGMFVSAGAAAAPFEFLEKEEFETAYGVDDMVKSRMEAFRPEHTRRNILGAVLCVLSPAFVILGAFSVDSVIAMMGVCALLAVAGIGVFMFITGGVRWESYQKLLRIGDYRKKADKTLPERIEDIYWPVVLAVYLFWSFLSSDWGITWIVWPVAAVMSLVVEAVCKSISKQ